MKAENNSTSYNQVLIQAGLSENQAVIYETLLKSGPLRASSLAIRTPFKRQLTYKLLDELVGLGLVIKDENKGKVAMFEPAHPLKLKQLAEEREKKAKESQNILEGVLHNLTSTYNITLGKPGVIIVEGAEEAYKLFKDSYYAKSPVWQYYDAKTVRKYFSNIDDAISNESMYKKKTRKIMAPNDNHNREILKDEPNENIQIKYIPFQEELPVVALMYDHKVIMITIGAKRIIGMSIENDLIYNFFTAMFKHLWLHALP